MRVLFIFLTFIAYLLSTTGVKAEQPTQVVRGRVVDKDSRQPLVGVTLIVEESDPVIGTTTNGEGYFKFQELEVGRYHFRVQYVGYENKVLPNVVVNAGKENVLHIELVESVVKLDEVVVSARAHKAEALNKMSTVSARSFTVDETKRYAGGFNDPSRMAASFAGVSGNPSGDNDIVIRGNSPRGMLWRLEGVEIPNPNHFSEEGASGGPISILNTTTLGNSDFFTGAFPAEYGNAYSGVFDINMRTGNNEKREYSLQAGVLGTDVSMEGPFSSGSKSSYLVNYRYSSLSMLNALGIKITGDAVPKFQDLTFKLRFPKTAIGDVSVFGIGGISHIHQKEDYWQNDAETDVGVLGVNNIIRLGSDAYIKNTLSVTGSQNIWDYEENDTDRQFYYQGEEKFKYQTVRAATSINKKMSIRHTLKSGITYSRLYYNLYSSDYDIDKKAMFTDLSEKGNAGMLQAYANWQFRPLETVTLNTGMHFMQLLLNDNLSIEPRMGMKWQLSPKQSVSAGFGIHSKAESLSAYFARAESNDGTTYQPNFKLGFGKARHYVLGYDHNLTKNLYLKTEVYYQELYDVPIENNDSSWFSALNFSSGVTNIELENKGGGSNYGIELTLEKFFSRNYYFLFTSSLYDSKFTAGNGKTYDTRYNGNYVFNLLGGKEFPLKKSDSKSSVLAVNLRGIWAGGQRYAPIDLAESIEKGYTKRNWENAFSGKYDDFIRFDLKVSFKRNIRNTTRVVELDIQNVTNNSNVAGNYFNRETQQTESFAQLGLLPVLNYRIEF
jgi:hypothetical protein